MSVLKSICDGAEPSYVGNEDVGNLENIRILPVLIK